MTDASEKPVAENGPRKGLPGRTPPAFWQLGLSDTERALLFAVVAMTAVLHLAPVAKSSLATPLLFVLPIVAFCSPVTGFFFISANQYLPFPPTAILNPAQIGAFLWLPMVLVRYRRLLLSGMGQIWPLILLLTWRYLCRGPSDEVEFLKDFVYFLMGIQLAHEARGGHVKCLFGLCLGSLLVTSAYWAATLGLPVEMLDWGGSREGFARMGGVRADSVIAWPPILVGVSGILGMLLAVSLRECQIRPPNWFKPLGCMFFIASLPPLVATICLVAFAGFVCVVLAFALAFARAQAAGAFSRRTANRIVGGAFAKRPPGSPSSLCRGRVPDADEDRVAWEVSMRGKAKRKALRPPGLWSGKRLSSRSTHPIIGGFAANDEPEILREFSAHNIFLDFGRGGGIAGLLLSVLFFFWPLIRAWPLRETKHLPFLLVYFAFFIFWMTLPFAGYKSFWGFWGLMIVAFPPQPKNYGPRPSSRKAVLPRRAAFHENRRFLRQPGAVPRGATGRRRYSSRSA